MINFNFPAREVRTERTLKNSYRSSAKWQYSPASIRSFHCSLSSYFTHNSKTFSESLTRMVCPASVRCDHVENRQDVHRAVSISSHIEVGQCLIMIAVYGNVTIAGHAGATGFLVSHNYLSDGVSRACYEEA